MADDKRVAEQRLEQMLMAMSRDRNDLEAYHNKGDAYGMAQYERLLEYDYSRIRKHCAEHDLELPHDVPPGAHPAASVTD